MVDADTALENNLVDSVGTKYQALDTLRNLINSSNSGLDITETTTTNKSLSMNFKERFNQLSSFLNAKFGFGFGENTSSADIKTKLETVPQGTFQEAIAQGVEAKTKELNTKVEAQAATISQLQTELAGLKTSNNTNAANANSDLVNITTMLNGLGDAVSKLQKEQSDASAALAKLQGNNVTVVPTENGGGAPPTVTTTQSVEGFMTKINELAKPDGDSKY